jgi:ABC-2 type transport system permease protein
VVALLVRLRLTLLRNSLRRSVWRTVGVVLGLLYALAVVIAAGLGLIALRFVPTELAADVTVVVFALLTAGWLLMSLLVFGVDETVDPARFALLPVRARELMPGLLVGGLVSSPGVATVLLTAVQVVPWTRSLPATLAAVIAAPLGVATCFLLSRAATAAFASVLSSRRFRDFAFVALALVGLVFAVGGNLLGGLAEASPDRLRGLLGMLASALGWTPFGWVWAVPADVGRGAWLVGLLRLAMAAGLVFALWRVWGHYLDRRLTEPVDGGGGLAKVGGGRWAARLYPATPAGAVATRTLAYWRRDPRYLAGIAGFVIGPVILLVIPLVNPEGSFVVAAFAPVLLCWLIGASMAQDLSYDGNALWLHASSGLRGADDRAGRAMSLLTVFAPVVVVLLVGAGLVSGRWDLMVPVTGLSIGFALAGVGVGAYVGVLWQWPAPPPGANPFQRSSSGGLPALASFAVSNIATLVVLLPTIGLTLAWFWYGWLGGPTVLVGTATGVIVLRVGIRLGGSLLDRRWPEVLKALADR